MVIRGIALPRRIEIYEVITTFASASLMRIFSAVVPNPVKTTLWTAPILAQASMAISWLWYHGHVDTDTVTLLYAQILEAVCKP